MESSGSAICQCYREDNVKPKGIVISVDLQFMAPIEGALVLPLSDFTTKTTQSKIKELLDNKKADVLLSDMAPRATGVKSHNHEVVVNLCFSVLRFALIILKPGGTVLCKLWMGCDQSKLEKAMAAVFENVRYVKPEASRGDSAEIYLLGKKFKGTEHKNV
ncbi:2' O-ribose methyltransferase [Bulinus truncatus]|nr:2' O-ribose methyltransferase [Bulinus truncatus]